MSNKSGAGAISLPKGGGAVSGLGEKFSPDLFTGTGNFSVPVALPPGRNGFQPELTLGYSTGNGNSAFGLGWNLGVPGVMRKTSKGIPHYDDERDVFILSGAEDLVPIVRTDLVEANNLDVSIGFKTQYRPRTEGLFARIEHHKYQDGRDFWKVWSKDGLVSFYGEETVGIRTVDTAGQPLNQAIIADPLHPAHVFAWHLTRTVDLFGNEIVYRYWREINLAGPHQYEQTYLRDIRYADYLAPPAAAGSPGPKRYLLSVEFTYATARPDPFSSYDSGFEQRTTRRCTEINTFTHPETADLPAGHAAGTGTEGNGNQVPVKTYALRYADQVPEAAQALNAASLLHSVQVIGHDGAQTEAMPPLEFGYSRFAPDLQRFFPVTGELPATSLASPDLELIDIFGNGLPDLVQLNGVARYWRNLGNGRFDMPRLMKDAPGGLQLADPEVQFIDANGDGKPDLLVSRDGLAGYFPLNQDGQWDRNSFQRYRQRPSFSLSDPEVRLLDLDGDGVTDVLRNGSRLEYFYNDPEQGFVATQQVAKRGLDAFPAVSFQDSRVRFAHLCSGLQALCLVHNGRIEYWPNLGRGRWGQRLTMRNSPVLPSGYNPAHVLLGDVDGDGLDDFIYVDNNKITLWLNQSGNGWSAPIEITGTPALTDASAVRITDLLGTGVAGVLWTRDAQTGGRQQQYLFLDLTGKVKPYVLHQMDNHLGALTRVGYVPSTQFYLADQQRPATRWQTPLPFPVQVVSHVEVIDQISGGKMSTEYRYHHGYWDGGEREFRGFGRVDQRDTQSFEDYHRVGLFADDPGGPLVRIAGDFDPEDFDAADFLVDADDPGLPLVRVAGDFARSDFAAADLLVETLAVPPRPGTGPTTLRAVAADAFAPPLETRTWFHLGPVGDGTGQWRELEWTGEYWAGDPPLLARPASMAALVRGLPRRQRRDAIRTLRGSVLRTELYALDGSVRQDRPYTVTESLTGVAQVLGVAAGPEVDVRLAFDAATPRPALAPLLSTQPIFFAHGLAQRTTQWERGEDPMTQVSFTADYDHYGQARRQLSAALPRGWKRAEPSAAGALVSTSRSQYAGDDAATGRNAYDTATQYLADRVARTEAWELVTDGTTLSIFDLLADAQAPTGTLPRRLLGQSQQYYDGPAFQGLTTGVLGAYGALTRSEVLLLTGELLTAAYGGVPPLLAAAPAWTSDYPQAFRDAYQAAYPQGRAGYRYEPAATSGLGTDAYYQTSERRQYDFQLPAPPARSYGVVLAMLDPLGTAAGASAATPQRVSRVTYDAYGLLPVQTTDALGHQTRAVYDYRLLQARLVIDPNGNRTAYGYSSLGLLRETALLGKHGAGEGDVKVETATADLVPEYQASTWLEYDFFAFALRGEPAWVRTTQREQHYQVSAASETLVKTEYSDGFGRLVQTRAQAEDVLFGEATFGDSGLPADAALPNRTAGGRRAAAGQVHVVVSGGQVYDNKGRVVEKYEPFFSLGFDFVLTDTIARGQRVRLFYDPRGQLVRTRNPDGTEQRVIYGRPSGTVTAPVLNRLDLFEPTPWETYTYDANDLAPLTHPNQPAAAAVAKHWYTPQSAEVDALGCVVRTTDRLEAATAGGPPVKVVMDYAYDIRGNRTQVKDAYGRTSFAHVYDLRPKAGEDDPGANVLYTRHLDGGVRRSLFDGAGQPLRGEDAKGALTLRAYDALGRPTDAWARDNAAEAVSRRQHLEYGANTSAAQATNTVRQLTAHYDEARVVRLLGYDFKGNLLEKEQQVVADSVLTAQWGAQAAASWQSLPAGFNTHWNELSAPAGRLAPRVYQTSTRYDALNRATRLTLPHEAGAGGARPVLVPSYNRAGALEQVRLDGQVLVERVAYNARGQRLLLARGNGLMTRYVYDAVSFRLLRLRTEGYTTREQALTPLSGSTRQDTSYGYDLAGNIIATTERAPLSGVAGAAELTRLYQYDALYRLLSASGRENQPTAAIPWEDSTRSEGVASTTAYTQRYRYDLLGNIEELRHTGASSAGSFTRQFDYGAKTTNYLQSVQVGAASYGYRYDANGNVVQEEQSRHLGWDAADQLRQFATWTGAGTAPTLLAYYLYDAQGQRVKKLTQTSVGTWQAIVYVDGGVFEHRYEVSNGTLSGEQTTVCVLDGQSRLFQRRAGDALDDLRPAELYTLENHLGSAIATVDTSGAVVGREEYYPFGETSFGSHAKQRYRFCGKERDQESGLYYYGARYYAPWICRFVSVDPLAAKYSSLTPYAYAANDPLSSLDDNGEGPSPIPSKQALIATRNAISDYESSLWGVIKGAGVPILMAVTSAGSNFKLEPYWRLSRNIKPNSFTGALGITGEGLAAHREFSFFNSTFANSLSAPHPTLTFHNGNKAQGTWDFRIDYSNRTPLMKVAVIGANTANGTLFNQNIEIGAGGHLNLLYEVKTYSKNTDAQTLASRIEYGFTQAIQNAALNKDSINVLYVDKGAYLKAYNSNPKLFQALYNELSLTGGFLMLKENHFMDTKQAVDQITKDIKQNTDNL